ncbi:hypothetical protein VUR80DRAFT_7984 [Thermomyces stellatus]
MLRVSPEGEPTRRDSAMDLDNPVVEKVTCDVEDGDTEGFGPTIQLFDASGEDFANYFRDAGLLGDGITTEKLELDSTFTDGDPPDLRRNPICISYVTVTAVSGSYHLWHAGYAKQCDSSLWYLSPKTVSDSDFTPDCIWLSNHDNDRFLQGVSFKLMDFAFPRSKETNAQMAKREFEEEPATLCKAPARMAFWEKMKAIEGHKMPCDWDKDTKLRGDEFDIPYSTLSAAETSAALPASCTSVQRTPWAGRAGPSLTSGKPVQEAGLPPPSTDPADLDLDKDGLFPVFGTDDDSASSIGPPPAELRAVGQGKAGALRRCQRMTHTPWMIVGVNPGGGTKGGLALPAVGPSRRRAHKGNIRSRCILQQREGLRRNGDLCVDALAVSDLPGHSATEVCGSQTSSGKVCGCEQNDGVAAEEFYCFDMETTTLRFPPHLVARELMI